MYLSLHGCSATGAVQCSVLKSAGSCLLGMAGLGIIRPDKQRLHVPSTQLARKFFAPHRMLQPAMLQDEACINLKLVLQVPWNALAEHLWGLHPTMPPPSSDPAGLDIMAVHGIQPGSSTDAHLRAFTDIEGFNWLRDGLDQALAPPIEQPLANLNSFTLRLPLDVLDSLSVLNIYDVATLLKVLLPDTGMLSFWNLRQDVMAGWLACAH